MKLTQIFEKLEEVGAVALSDEFCRKYRLYDNSGIIINTENEITGALFSLDLSLNAIKQAKERGYNLIITHHPAIYGGVSRINANDPIAICIRDGISVISMHLNFDSAPQGIDYYLMCGLGGKDAEIHNTLECGGYGRVYSVEPIAYSELVKKVNQTFKTHRAVFYGSEDKVINKIASFCGAGCNEQAIAFALSHGADAFASSDMKHHEIAALVGKGINVIHLTHYSAESYGFNRIYDTVAPKLGVLSAFFADEELL